MGISSACGIRAEIRASEAYISKRSEYAAFRLSASVSSGSKRFGCVVRSVSGFRL